MTTDIAGILEDVVHQFSDPFAFFRELVQNSLDAGTGEIEITIDFECGEGVDRGLLIVSVQDFGCGMSREVIETQLCRLFSSAKYGDLTKIGRFGIGFVSVYGVEPDWVCVDTGRDGESWRIIFMPDRSFELRTLRVPCEGTLVRVAKSMTPVEADEFSARAREVVSNWCAHVAVPVAFDGEDLRQPFEIDSPCAIEFEESGTRAVVGLVADRGGAASYYNRGLLLQQRDRSPWPHVAFKIDSRFLEHTLTRDDLLHDRGYHRVAAMLERLAKQRLPQRLLAEMEELAAAGDVGPRAIELWLLLTALSAGKMIEGWESRAIVATVRGPRTPKQLTIGDSVYFTTHPSALAAAVAELGHDVVLGDAEVLGAALGQRPRSVDEHWTSLDPRSWSEHAAARAFVPQLRDGLALWDIVPERVWLGRWDGPTMVVREQPNVPVLRAELRGPKVGEIDDRPLLLNLADPVVQACVELAPDDIDLGVAALLSTIDRPRGLQRLITLATKVSP